MSFYDDPFRGEGRRGWTPRGAVVRERPPGPWPAEREGAEGFEGAGALADLATVGDDPLAAAVVVARYLAVRLVLRAAAGRIAGETLCEERLAAAIYVVWPAAPDAERRVLGTLVRLAASRPAREIVPALREAGAMAAAQDHAGCAAALLEAACDLAIAGGWTDEALEAARALARLAVDQEDLRGRSRWERRVAMLARRLAREQAAGDGA